MELTYSFRRVFINEEKRPIKEIIREYRCLFDEEEICNEFSRLMADDMLQRGINRLLQLSPKILNYAKSKGNSPTIKKYLGYLDQGVEDLVDDEVPEDKSLVALLCLPLLLEKETKQVQKPHESFLKVVPTEKDLAELKEDSPPFILIVGELPNYDDIFIVAEGEKLLKVTGGHLVAVKCLISFYYTLNFCYPKACANTFIFLQKHFLQIFDSQKNPVKVTVFINELSK